MEKILFIGVVVLLIFGPEKVPAIARTLGNLMREFQNALHPAPMSAQAQPPVPRPKTRRVSARRKKHSTAKK